jgi:hypothetical protein
VFIFDLLFNNYAECRKINLKSSCAPAFFSESRLPKRTKFLI